MKPEELYLREVLSRIPPGPLRDSIAMELRSHIADRLERGESAEAAIRQLGDPRALAESYLAAIPLRNPSFIRRAIAKGIDLFLFAVIPFIALGIGLPFRMVTGMVGRHFDEPILFAAVLIALVSIPLSCVYIILVEHWTGQTLGKRLFGLQVVTEKGTRIGLGQSFLRQLPLFLEIFMVDALFALFTEKKQRGFELITKTRVVDVRDARRGAPAPLRTVA